LEDSPEENSKTETQDRFTDELEHSEKQSQNGGGNRNKESERNIARSIEETVEKTSAKK